MIARSTNLRLTNDPAAALVYIAHRLIDPAVAPLPRVDREAGAISYEPIRPWPYARDEVAGPLAWGALLAASVVAVGRDRRGCSLLALLLPWLAFNLPFHNLWGDEFFLYTPHWSWALGAVLLMGARRLPFWVVAALAVPVIVVQLNTLSAYRDAIATLDTFR